MADNDLTVLEDAMNAAFALDKTYRLAVRNNDLDAMLDLKPQVDAAFERYSMARLNLLKPGVLATDADVAEMRRVKAEIDRAAGTQQLIAGAIRLAAFLAKFA